MLQKLLAIMFSAAAFAAVRTDAITFDSFGPNGEGGSKNGQTFTIGVGGTVFEYDAFLFLGGADLNGAQLGTSADLAINPLPTGLQYGFSSALTNGTSDLVLLYSFTNTTTNVFTDVRFFAFLDAEIDQAINTFFNEYGTQNGTAGSGAGDGTPDQWQIDEPGFETGKMLQNLFLGTLSNSNSVPIGSPNDVSMALGFSVGNMNPGSSNQVEIVISEAGRSVGPFYLTQRDSAATSTTTITFSGTSLPNGSLTNNSPTNTPTDLTGVMPFGITWRLNKPTGSLIGTLSITNPASSGITAGPNFQLGLISSTNLYYVRPDGILTNGLPYVDFTPQFSALVSGGVLAPGQTVVMSNSIINVYSAGRAAPNITNFQFWATPK